jgi:hypothetical protein
MTPYFLLLSLFYRPYSLTYFSSFNPLFFQPDVVLSHYSIIPRRKREERKSGREQGEEEGDVGAADKAAIQLVKVQPCQLLVSDT